MIKLLCGIIFATFIQFIAYYMIIIIYISIKQQLQMIDNAKQMIKHLSFLSDRIILLQQLKSVKKLLPTKITLEFFD